MAKLTTVPYDFTDGSTLSPRELNDNLDHLKEEVGAVQDKRYDHFSYQVPWHRSVSTPYTQDGYQEELRYRVQFPQDVTLTFAQLKFFGTGDGDVSITLYNSVDGYIPSSSVDLLTVTPTAAETSYSDATTRLILFRKDEEYIFEMVPATGVTFSSKNTWLELHFRSDRFNLDQSELLTSYTPSRFTSADTATASTIATEFSNLDTALTSVSGNTTITRAQLVMVHDLESTTNSSLRRWRQPFVDSDVTDQIIAGIYASATTGVQPSVSTTVRARWLDDSDVVQSTANMIIGTTETYETIASVATQTFSSASGDHTNSSQDWKAELLNQNASDTVIKAYITIFYS